MQASQDGDVEMVKVLTDVSNVDLNHRSKVALASASLLAVL